MSFPVGNEFWKNRSKHGRDALFATASLLWDAATEYFDWCQQNPLIEIDYVGKERVEKPKMRAFTLHGLCIYLDCNTQYFKTYKSRLDRETQAGRDFDTVITRIEEVIYEQKFTGAAAGFLHPNIIARDLGLADKIDKVEQVTVTVKRQRKERPEHG